MAQAPTILVFDSGLGGLTVYREVKATRPDARFVYLADVYLLDECRGQGLGAELVREMVENGPYADRRWVLHTRDAHALYEKFGFGPNVRLMERGSGR